MNKKIRFKILLLSIISLLPFLLSAQVKDTISTSAKIDSIYNLQKKMYNESKNVPLINKNYGIELNLFRLLLISNWESYSGSFSFFNIDRNAEISFPFYFQNPKKSTDLLEFTLDCHYRYFLGNTQNGFYLSGFARYAFLRGTLGENSLFSFNNQPNEIKESEHKLGIGFGLGYRKFSYKHLYWGASISFGRYLIGKNDRFAGDLLPYDDDSQFIFDIELLKFGWAF